ncbi:hypothetical protein IWW38_006061, partial [Coemansia aciculifera]
QQRYDPHVSRSSGGPCEASPRGIPRTATSIPSFRGLASENVSSAVTPTGNHGSSRSNTKHAEQRVLRHQSTLPDFSQLSKPAASSATRLPSLTLNSTDMQPGFVRDAFADTAGAAYSLRSTKPPLARLASNNSYAADSSPVHTLVYDDCSPVVSTTRHRAGNAAYALTSLSADAQGLTLSEATSGPSSKRCNGDATTDAIYADVTCAPTANGLQVEYVQAAASGGSGNGTGWQLKSKILHPLSTWFRLSRQNQYNGALVPPAPSSATSDPTGSGRDESAHTSAAC